MKDNEKEVVLAVIDLVETVVSAAKEVLLAIYSK